MNAHVIKTEPQLDSQLGTLLVGVVWLVGFAIGLILLALI